MKQNYPKKAYWLLALICLLLAGCGAGDNMPSGTGSGGTVPGGTASEGAQISREENVSAVKQQEDPAYYVDKVDVLHFREPMEGVTEYGSFYKTLGNQIYLLRVEDTEQDDRQGINVQSIEIESGEAKQCLIIPDVPGREHSRIYSADLTADLELSLKMQEEGEDTFFLVRMNLEGEVLRVEENFPRDTYPWNPDIGTDTQAFDLSDGRTILCRYDSGKNVSKLSWYREDGEEEPLGTLEDTMVHAMTVDGNGILYYLGNGSLVRWDVAQNTREELFRMWENGIEMQGQAFGVAVNGEGKPQICLLGDERGMIYHLTDEEAPGEDKIRLCSLEGEAGISYFRNLAASFPQKGGKMRIGLELEKKAEYQEDYKNAVLAEMAAGKGPDILYVSRQDMILLQEKGLLLDLTDMIPEDIRKELIPGALELGSIGGQLAGLVPEVNFTTMGTARATYDQDSWTVEEFVERMEEKEYWDVLFNFSGYAIGGKYFFKNIIPYELESLSLLDTEQGTCDFQNDKFIHILEFCKKYASQDKGMASERWDQDEGVKKLREGVTGADILYFYQGFSAFSAAMARYGEDCRIVGYPTGEGSGSYVDSYSFGYLVVNARTKYQEEIQKYLALLLDYNSQLDTQGCSVRMDVLRNLRVEFNTLFDGYYAVQENPDNPDRPVRWSIDVKPDGTSYLEEFLAFVEGCRPKPYCPPEIVEILCDEGDAYFDGGKSAQETAEIIQRRVQLYLDENR